MFQVDRLKKSFREINAVKSVSFSINSGEIFGLLGPNGAGKSTIINMITGLVKPDGGSIYFNGSDCTSCSVSFRKHLGTAPQEIALYEDLSAMDNLKFWGAVHGIPGNRLDSACRHAAERVGLTDRVKDRVKTYSDGMKRRLNLAVAVQHHPDLLLLDEPTAGVDPQSRHHLLSIVKDLAGQGTAVLNTTHYLEEAEAICDRIGIIDNGTLIAEGTVDELCSTVQTGRIVTLDGRFQSARVTEKLASYSGVRIANAGSERIILRLDSDENLVEIMRNIFNEDLDIRSVAVKPPSLETVFLLLTGKELRD